MLRALERIPMSWRPIADSAGRPAELGPCSEYVESFMRQREIEGNGKRYKLSHEQTRRMRACPNRAPELIESHNIETTSPIEEDDHHHSPPVAVRQGFSQPRVLTPEVGLALDRFLAEERAQNPSATGAARLEPDLAAHRTVLLPAPRTSLLARLLGWLPGCSSQPTSRLAGGPVLGGPLPVLQGKASFDGSKLFGALLFGDYPTQDL